MEYVDAMLQLIGNTPLLKLNRVARDVKANVFVKLEHLNEWNARRLAHAQDYNRLLSQEEIILPSQPSHATHVYHNYVIRHPDRDRLQAFLAERLIRTLVHYPLPVHLQPAYANLGYQRGDLPNSELAAQQVLSLPMYPEISTAAVETVSKAIADFIRSSEAIA